MKGKIKANTVDKYLRPIREQICDLVGEGAQVLEIGCGNGDQLFSLAPKIEYGTGLDINEKLVAHAHERKNIEGRSNLDFRVADVVREGWNNITYDTAIVSLVLHVIKPEEANSLVHKLMSIADEMIICGFCAPTNRWQQFLLWLDQRFSGHYHNFKVYQNNGYMQDLLIGENNWEFEEYDTFDPVIKVYRLRRPHK